MKTQIPIYRAKKIDSDGYIEGYLFKIWEVHYILWGTTNGNPIKTAVHSSTLAIHFPDMLDKNGVKIFASLSEDGKGGDILTHSHTSIIFSKNVNTTTTCVFNKSKIEIQRVRVGLEKETLDLYNFIDESFKNAAIIEVTGIYKGAEDEH